MVAVRLRLAAAYLVVLMAISHTAAGQMKMTVGQLKGVLRSSIQLNHPDKQVADYVKNIRLTEQLTERDIQELLAEGIGTKTADALKALASASASQPKPATDPVKPTAPPPPMPAPSSTEQRKTIEEAREIALSYTNRLPDFICLQVTRRYYDPSGPRAVHAVGHNRQSPQLLRAEGRLQAHFRQRPDGRHQLRATRRSDFHAASSAR